MENNVNEEVKDEILEESAEEQNTAEQITYGFMT